MITKKTIIVIMFFITLMFNAFAQETDEQRDQRYRHFIDEFLDTYIAAYEQEQIEYIADFFSTDALIITETKKLLKNGAEAVPRTSKKRPYEQIVEDKKTYINRLREIFAANVKIKLGIADKRVMRHGNYQEIYGISFLQLWKDQNGGDNLESQMPGYIFLMIDFKTHGEMEPIIHVRTWQPKDNIKTPKDKYSLYDFNVYEF